jgi:hypothetical protein
MVVVAMFAMLTSTNFFLSLKQAKKATSFGDGVHAVRVRARK